MKEQTLKDYFDEKVTVDTLATDLKDSQQKTGYDTSSVCVDQIKEEGEYQVTRKHLLKLCNDTIKGHLTPGDLNTVAFALLASEYFTWDSETGNGDIVSTTTYDWDNPDLNFDLTIDNLKLWREYLETGEYKLKEVSGQNESELRPSRRILKDKRDAELHPKWKKDFKKIREILNEWDPLGVADVVDDEYDEINFLAYSVLMRNGGIEEIKKSIKGYLAQSMEIDETDEKLEEISMKIKNAVQKT
ncbi:hypothetical protein [Prolixibacter sp. NT017]|uniref:hypothetical protein n=1 Tax=Prolixibacter sp. NT017 TaxID=2652390 RepID=UPI00126C0DD9|nr:hypothetical protein [Prolixibacter sp. NT017]GET24281.1 hypothetical protein NT017_06100 [Prolixibacter sp. NT017]